MRSEVKQYSLIERDIRIKQVGLKRALLFVSAILLLFVLQQAIVKMGGFIADFFSYDKIDPYNAYAWNFVHHIVILLLSLAVVLTLGRMLKTDFHLGLGDKQKGIKFTAVYTVVFAGITLVTHILMALNNSLPVYEYPLSTNNIIGSLGFNLFLTGPVEEMLFRALTITVLAFVLGKNVKFKWGITLENIVAAFLFAFAHVKWTLFPLSIEANYFGLLYAFAQGIISGKAYQDCKSVIYPMYMHSISNLMMVGTGYLFLLLQ